MKQTIIDRTLVMEHHTTRRDISIYRDVRAMRMRRIYEDNIDYYTGPKHLKQMFLNPNFLDPLQ